MPPPNGFAVCLDPDGDWCVEDLPALLIEAADLIKRGETGHLYTDGELRAFWSILYPAETPTTDKEMNHG
jgi:hypothetical protein